MGTLNQTKKCTKCGKELPLSAYGKDRNGLKPQCRECLNAAARLYQKKKRENKNVLNPLLAEVSPQELISELRSRGYEGTLSFKEIKIHKVIV